MLKIFFSCDSHSNEDFPLIKNLIDLYFLSGFHGKGSRIVIALGNLDENSSILTHRWNLPLSFEVDFITNQNDTASSHVIALPQIEQRLLGGFKAPSVHYRVHHYVHVRIVGRTKTLDLRKMKRKMEKLGEKHRSSAVVKIDSANSFYYYFFFSHK